jgi:hypothetical protein
MIKERTLAFDNDDDGELAVSDGDGLFCMVRVARWQVRAGEAASHGIQPFILGKCIANDS